MDKNRIHIPKAMTIGEAKKRIKRNYPDLYISIGRDEATRARKKYSRRTERIYKRLRKQAFEKAKIDQKFMDDMIIEIYGNYKRTKRTLEQLQSMWHTGFDTAWKICQAKHEKCKEIF